MFDEGIVARERFSQYPANMPYKLIFFSLFFPLWLPREQFFSNYSFLGHNVICLCTKVICALCIKRVRFFRLLRINFALLWVIC